MRQQTNNYEITLSTEGMTIAGLWDNYNLNLMDSSNQIETPPPQNEGRAYADGNPNKLYNNFLISESSKHGLGLFAKGNIKKGEKFFYPLPTVEKADGDKFFIFEKIYDLRDSELQYLNHSDTPNMDYEEMQGGAKLIAFKDIKIGEELTIDYGWEEYPWNKLYTQNLGLDLHLPEKRYFPVTAGNGDTILCYTDESYEDVRKRYETPGYIHRTIQENLNLAQKFINENVWYEGKPKDSKLTRFKNFFRNIFK